MTACAQYLDENVLLIEAILQNQNLGRLENCLHYQLQLQQNLIYLGVHADKEPELRALEFTRHPNNRQAPPAATSSAASNATQPPAAHAAPAEQPPLAPPAVPPPALRQRQRQAPQTSAY